MIEVVETKNITCVSPKPQFPLSYDDAIEYIVENDYTKYLDYDKRNEVFEKLCIIADVWNEIDQFVPDYSDDKQDKHTPILINIGKKDFVTCSNLSFKVKTSPFAFKTSERAEEFAKTFKDLLKTYLNVKS